MAYHVRVYTTDTDGRKFPVDRETFPDYRTAMWSAKDTYEFLSGEPMTRDMRHVIKVYNGNRLVDEMVWEGAMASSRPRRAPIRKRAVMRRY